MTANLEYYYKDENCKAANPRDPDCICWHDGSLMPHRVANPKTWRAKQELVDGHLDAILKASGSGLKYYSMESTRREMRNALCNAIGAAATPLMEQLGEDKWLIDDLVHAVVSSVPASAKLIVFQLNNLGERDAKRIDQFAELLRNTFTLSEGQSVVIADGDFDIASMDDAQLLKLGYIRVPKGMAEPKCDKCGDTLCGGTGIYDDRKCDGVPF